MNMGFYRIIRFLLLIFFVVLCESFTYTLNIIKGNFVNKSIYPTAVLLYEKDHDETFDVSSCSGIIVSENVVLTAAHCLLSLQNGYDLDNPSYEIKSKGVMIDNVLVTGATPIVLPECVDDFIQDQHISQSKVKLDEDYSVFGSISREKYELMRDRWRDRAKKRFTAGLLAGVIAASGIFGVGTAVKNFVSDENHEIISNETVSGGGNYIYKTSLGYPEKYNLIIIKNNDKLEIAKGY